MPIQTEVDRYPTSIIISLSMSQVRTLLNDYITDEEQGVVSGRNPISSINEVLREGKYNRDRAKVITVLFLVTTYAHTRVACLPLCRCRHEIYHQSPEKS